MKINKVLYNFISKEIMTFYVSNKNLIKIFIFNIIIFINIIVIKNCEQTKQYEINTYYFKLKIYFNFTFENKIINKIRIAIYTYNLKNGGIQRISSLLVNYLYKIKIFNLYLFSQNVKENNEYNIPNKIKRILIRKPRFISIFKELKKKKIDILLFQFPNVYGIEKLNKLKDTKIIYFQHYSLFYWIYNNYTFFNSLYKSYQSSKYIVSLIPIENDYLFQKWGIKSILMNNFITFEYNSVIISELSEKTILMIGRSNDRIKRLELGIQSMEYITKRINHCEMKIISNITNNYFLKLLVDDLNLENNIKFVGYSSSPEIYFKNSSLHIFSTISESFGLVLSETKIYGIPSILLGLDYVSISNGGTSIIYDDKPESISKIAMKILLNEKYKKKLGIEARISIRKFKNELLLNKWVNLLLSVYNGDKYYKALTENEKKISETKALNILKNQIMLLKMRNPKFKDITENNINNFSFLEYLNIN